MLTLHLILETLAVVAALRQPAVALRILTAYMLLFDGAGATLLANGHGYTAEFWYFYWVGRTLSIILLIILVAESIVRKAPRAMRTMSGVWSLFMVVLTVVLVAYTWLLTLHDLQNATVHMLRMSFLTSAVCIILCLVAVVSIGRSLLLLGALLWALATAASTYTANIHVYAAVYPRLSIAPVLTWACFLFISRGNISNDASTERSAGRWLFKGRRAAAPNDCGDGATSLQGARQWL